VGTGFSPASRSKLFESITFMASDRFDPKPASCSDFIASDEGQAIVRNPGYVPADPAVAPADPAMRPD
jgi:hypothetical protein